MLHPDLKNEFDSLHPGDSSAAGASRRTALKIAIGVGYAAATLPIAAQTVVNTTGEGLKAGPVRYAVNGFDVPAYMAMPAGKADLPVILVVQEAFGVTDYIADTCRRFAHQGFLAIAPELYARQGDPRKFADTSKLMGEIVSKVPDAQVLADLDGALDFAGANGGNVAKAGITGFCWGGRIVWLYAATGKVKAGVAWYGRLVGQASALTPRQPVDVGAMLQAPVLGLYGGQDQGIPLDTIDKMKSVLAIGTPAARASQLVVYAEAGHAFHADYRPSYVKSAANDGWRRALEWFTANGVG
ncbi:MULTISPECIES: dienelactone hydrolase family protein [unclassified Variovorax]|uniref:dienelactone hydrolase family protein n=1 Tax=unclassified Variovorax TaxID=663243 RepID=UPI001BD60F73|nr:MULTISPECIES: dienelactone hydrolase family protein [unclassified Variovorax]